MKVKFHKGIDKGYYLKQLNEEIVQYLTPWAFDEKADVSFNQKIYASSIINFIEERSYVDFITDFFMGVCKSECCSTAPASTPRPDEEETIDSAIVEGQVLDGYTQDPLPGVQVLLEGTDMGTITDIEGRFQLELAAEQATIRISMVGYQEKVKSVSMHTRYKLYMHSVHHFGNMLNRINPSGHKDRKHDSLENIFRSFCGCDEVEDSLEQSGFVGNTVVSGTTPRSLLVSAPKHLILPYIDEVPPDPCALSQKQKMKQALQPEKAFFQQGTDLKKAAKETASKGFVESSQVKEKEAAKKTSTSNSAQKAKRPAPGKPAKPTPSGKKSGGKAAGSSTPKKKK